MIFAVFHNQKDLLRAAARLRAEHGALVETYTAEEPEVSPDAPDTTVSRIPLVVLAAGVVGTAGMFLLQAYATTIAYPLDIGGRPDFAWPSYIPNAFEMGVLLAVVTGFVAFLAANRLPKLYEPIDERPAFRNVMRDGNVLTIRRIEPARARVLLAAAGPDQAGPYLIEEIPG